MSKNQQGEGWLIRKEQQENGHDVPPRSGQSTKCTTVSIQKGKRG